MACLCLLSNSSWHFITLAGLGVLGQRGLTSPHPAALEISRHSHWNFGYSWIPNEISLAGICRNLLQGEVRSSFSGEVKMLKLFAEL